MDPTYVLPKPVRASRVIATRPVAIETDPTLPTDFLAICGASVNAWACASCGTEHAAGTVGIHLLDGRSLCLDCFHEKRGIA